MKKMLEFLINRSHREDLKLLFGENAYIKIENIQWSTTTKRNIIHVKLLINDIENSVDAYPEGVDYLLTESLKYIIMDEKPIIIKTIEFKN